MMGKYRKINLNSFSVGVVNLGLSAVGVVSLCGKGKKNKQIAEFIPLVV